MVKSPRHHRIGTADEQGEENLSSAPPVVLWASVEDDERMSVKVLHRRLPLQRRNLDGAQLNQPSTHIRIRDIVGEGVVRRAE